MFALFRLRSAHSLWWWLIMTRSAAKSLFRLRSRSASWSSRRSLSRSRSASRALGFGECGILTRSGWRPLSAFSCRLRFQICVEFCSMAIHKAAKEIFHNIYLSNRCRYAELILHGRLEPGNGSNTRIVVALFVNRIMEGHPFTRLIRGWPSH